MNRKPHNQQGRQFLQILTQNGELQNRQYIHDTPSAVRAIAEYEDMGGVLIAYPGTQTPSHIQQAPDGQRTFGIPDELIVRMQQAETDAPVHIFILCAEQNLYTQIIEQLQHQATEMNLSFDPELIHFVAWNTDTYWTRDYAPWWIYNKDADYYGIAKHQYTSLGGGSVGLVEGAEHVSPRQGHGIFRPNDDYAAVYFSDYLNAPIRKWNAASWEGHKNPLIKPHRWYNLGLLEVGGNYMVNGSGIVASTYLVAKQNELPTAYGNPEEPSFHDVEKRMKYILNQFNQFMGIQEYMALVDPSGTYIGHIDCWSKFLAKDKVLLAESEDPKVNESYNHIAHFYESHGFQVYRVMCQNIYVPDADDPATTAAYTNSLILNQCIYVPVAGGIYQQQDEAALAVYRNALPGYQVFGIPGRPETPWLGTDALHCRTHGIPRAVVKNWLKSQMK